MKSMQKNTKLWDHEDDDEHVVSRERNFQRRQTRNWKKVWMEHAQDAEEYDEFFK